MDEQERERQQAAETDERREVVGQLVLHEERAEVEVLRELAGTVQIRRVVTERQETVPITLISERLEITVTEGGGRVRMNGEELEPGRTYTVELSEERAQIHKQVYPFQEVTIAKQRETFTQTEQVTLRREELDVQRLDVRGPDLPGSSDDSQR
ncbi:MAG: YsnF/AvaK domain-containing protein [Deinococcota bacterium]